MSSEITEAETSLRGDKLNTSVHFNRFLDLRPGLVLFELGDLKKLATHPTVWQPQPHVNIKTLKQYFYQHPENKARFQLLDIFLQKIHLLQALMFLPDVIQLHRILTDMYSYLIDPHESMKLTVDDFVKHNPGERGYLVDRYIQAWNRVHKHIPNELENLPQTSKERCYKELDRKTCSLNQVLPSTSSDGMCPRALVLMLIKIQNAFMKKYHKIRGTEESTKSSQTVQPNSVTTSHLVTFDTPNELLSTIRTHGYCDIETGELSYHLEELEQSIEDKLVRGRPTIVEKVIRVQFRGECRSEAVFGIIRKELPQEPLSSDMKSCILAELTQLTELCDVLRMIEIIIGFLASLAAGLDEHQKKMTIKEYLQEHLSVSADQLLKLDSKSYHRCSLTHILTLWQVLAVTRASERFAKKQEPFEDIDQRFQIELGEEIKSQLMTVLSRVDLDRFIGELYEYIDLSLRTGNDSEIDISSWSLLHCLTAYIDNKNEEEIRGVQHIPDSILLSNATSTWKAALQYKTRLLRQDTTFSNQPDTESLLSLEDENFQSHVDYTPDIDMQVQSLIPHQRVISKKQSALVCNEGGTIVVADTGASLHIPEGAIRAEQPVEITVSVYWGLEYQLLEDDAFAIGPAVFCEPAGMSFARPVTLTVPHSAENLTLKQLKVWTIASSREAMMTGRWQIFYDGKEATETTPPAINLPARQAGHVGSIKLRLSHFTGWKFWSYRFGKAKVNMNVLAYMHPNDIQNAKDVFLKLFCVREDEVKVVEKEEDELQCRKCASRRPLIVVINKKDDMRFKMVLHSPGDWKSERLENVIPFDQLRVGGLGSICTSTFTKVDPGNSDVKRISGNINVLQGDKQPTSDIIFSSTMMKQESFPSTPTTSATSLSLMSPGLFSRQSSAPFPVGGASGGSSPASDLANPLNTRTQVLSELTDALKIPMSFGGNQPIIYSPTIVKGITQITGDQQNYGQQHVASPTSDIPRLPCSSRSLDEYLHAVCDKMSRGLKQEKLRDMVRLMRRKDILDDIEATEVDSYVVPRDGIQRLMQIVQSKIGPEQAYQSVMRCLQQVDPALFEEVLTLETETEDAGISIED